MKELKENIRKDLGLTGDPTEDCKKILRGLDFNPCLKHVGEYEVAPIEYNIKDNYIGIVWMGKYRSIMISLYSPEEHVSLLGRLLSDAELLYKINILNPFLNISNKKKD
jgi:hypothetical protein